MERVCGGDREDILSEFGGYKTEQKYSIIQVDERERLALRKKVKDDKHLQMYGQSRISRH